MKLYVVLNMLEILERLLRSLGKDLIDNMIRTFIRIINLRSYVYILRNSYNNEQNEKENSDQIFLQRQEGGVQQPQKQQQQEQPLLLLEQMGVNIKKHDNHKEDKNLIKYDNKNQRYLNSQNKKIEFIDTSQWDSVKNNESMQNYMNSKDLYQGQHYKNKNMASYHFHRYNEKENNFSFFQKNNKDDKINKNFKIPLFYPFYSILIKFIVQYIFVLAYILTHSFAHLIRFLSLNIAINSSE
ncbi:cyclic amine resistance locus protein, putative (CARL), partial [Plasmodium malariae]